MQKRHRLLVYDRLSKRWRGIPLFTTLLGVLLLVLIRLDLAPDLADYERVILGLIALNAAFFALLLFTGTSFVEARAKALYVRAGFLGLNISYRRIVSVFPTSLGQYHSPDSLKRWERILIEPLVKISSTAIELKGLPMNERILHQFWSKFLFMGKKKGLVFTIRNPLLLNQQIEHRRDRYLDSLEKRRKKEPDDVLDRIASRRGD